MRFTFEWYGDLVDRLLNKKFSFCGFNDCDAYEKCVIMRHDIDSSVTKALELASLENEKGIGSTYFFLLNTEFYNVGAKDSREMIRQIHKMGHSIGLHFDETIYPAADTSDDEKFEKIVMRERDMLSAILDIEVDAVSMHRPSKGFLDRNMRFKEIVNAYQQRFFNSEFKYLSDSRMRWRENIDEIIADDRFDKLQILTHPFWYNEKEKTMEEALREFVENAAVERYNALKENFTALEDVFTL